MSDYAGELTGGEFGLGAIQGDYDGAGVRYSDKRQALTWRGRHAARLAAAYYFGVVDVAHEGDIGGRPKDIQTIGRFLVNWRESAVREGAEAYSAYMATGGRKLFGGKS